jgi:PRTRC genetic system protein B
VIGPGQALRVEELAELIRGLQNAPTARRIQSERVLYSDPGMLMFWVPETRRPIFFRAPQEKSKPRKINAVSGTTVSHPPLLVVATPGNLYLFALGQNERPTASTELYRAPYYNLYESGLMCRGNVALPETMDPSEEALKRWEDAFFLTNFTHSNYHGKSIVSYRGGHDALWVSLAKRAGSFQTKYLIAIDRTVGKVLADGVKGSK